MKSSVAEWRMDGIRSAAAMFLVLALSATAQGADPDSAAVPSLDQLLRQVLDERRVEAEANAEREKRFLAEHEQQQARVNEVKARLAAEKARSEQLRATYAAQQEAMVKARGIVKDAAGEAGDLQGLVKQIAGDLEGTMQSSMISAQVSGRAARATEIAKQQGVPSIASLEDLWHMLLQEAVESGKVKRFPVKVVGGEGQETERVVTRVGTFTAIADGQFLRYLPETGRLLAPGRQPEAHLLRMAADLEKAKGGVVPFPIDPTRGAILALLGQSPTLIERIRQAGVIGYLILTLGGIALLTAIERFVRLSLIRRRVDAQQRTASADTDNPLGRLRRVAQSNPQADAETLGLKLDEAILIEVPDLRKRLPMLSVLATAAPLFGLLGTVAGMIETFQSMTLFGAGDPKVVSGGISLALVSTELGLIVAIPILLLHAWLHGLSNSIVHALEQESAGLIASCEEKQSAVAQRTR